MPDHHERRRDDRACGDPPRGAAPDAVSCVPAGSPARAGTMRPRTRFPGWSDSGCMATPQAPEDLRAYASRPPREESSDFPPLPRCQRRLDSSAIPQPAPGSARTRADRRFAGPRGHHDPWSGMVPSARPGPSAGRAAWFIGRPRRRRRRRCRWVAVQGCPGPVVAHGGPRVGVRGGVLHVAQRYPGVQRGGDERLPQRVRPDPLADCRPPGGPAGDPGGAVAVRPPAVGAPGAPGRRTACRRPGRWRGRSAGPAGR